MDYIRFTEGLNDHGKLVPISEMGSLIKDYNKDYYRSLFLYNNVHFEQFKKTKTISGIVDVETPNLVFDFDSSEDLEKARQDTIELCNRLEEHGVSNFVVCFSGSKGFSVEITTSHRFKPTQIKNIAQALAKGLATFDTKIYNASRLFRMPYTKHNKSGLFKIPITRKQLIELNSASIKELAKDLNNGTDFESIAVELPKSILDYANTDIRNDIKNNSDILIADVDVSLKPKNIPLCKYHILNGNFKPGNRSHSLMALGAHYKAQGMPKEVTFGVLKGASELQAARFNQEPFSEKEIQSNIINVIYSPNWKGATYSCKDHTFLQELCGNKCNTNKKDSVTNVVELADTFTNFAVNFDKNIIKTGLSEIDKNLIITTSMSVGLLGSPGSGKTAMCLKILANVKQKGSTGLFCSLDMGAPIIFAKMAANVSGISADKIIDIFKNDGPKREEIKRLVKEKYGHFPISFKSGQTVADIKQMVQEQQEKLGSEKIKLVMIDYLECLAGTSSDNTANTAMFSKQLKDMANELEICIITLVQPQKSSGDASEPLLSMRKIKGASSLEQDFRAILSVYREGFSPTHPEDDRFMSISCLKNTFGGLFTVDYRWEGLKGELHEMNETDRFDLTQIRERKNSEKNSDNYD